MASDSTVEVKFGASTDELKAGVDDVKNKLGEVGGAGDALAGKLTSVAGAIAGAFSVDKIAEFVEGTAKAAEQIERLHNITGLSTDTIQTLQYAMQMAGGDADQAAMMMSRFERNIAEASAGSGTAYNAFTQLGVGLDMLQHGTPEEIFRKMADGFRSINDPAMKADVAIALLGRSGAALVPVLSQGSAGLAQMAARLDQTHDRLDPGAVESFAHLERCIIDMGKALEGSMRTGLTPFVDLIDRAVQLITKLTEGITNLGGSLLGMAKNAAMLTQLLGMAATGNKGTASTLAGGAEYGSPIGPNKPAAKINRTGLSADESDDGDTEAKQRSLYAENYDVKKEYDALAVASGQESHQQELADLQAALAQEQVLVDKSFTDQMAEYDKDSAEYNNLMAEKKIADERFEIEHMKLMQEATKSDTKVWTDAFNGIDKAFDTMLAGILQGTQTIGQVFQKMAQNLVITFASAIAEMLVKWVAFQAATALGLTQMASGIAGSGGGDAGGVMTKLATVHLSLVGIETVSATGTDANTVAIVGLTAAVIANTAAVGLSSATHIPGFAVGTAYVPNDMVARIRKGEAIIPAAQNSAIQKGQMSFGSSSSGDTHVHLNVSAMDAGSVAGMFKKHGSAIANALISASRGGHNDLNRAFARM